MKDLNPYYAYLQVEARKAREARDRAVARYILDAVESIVRFAKTVAAGLFHPETRRDDAWAESMETRLRQHQPY
jgi:hypothetical protein